MKHADTAMGPTVNSMFSLDGKSALVTGGGSGIGLGMALALSEAGARVTLWGRNADRLARARERFPSSARVWTDVVDVSDATAVADRMGAAADQMDGLDTVVVNAGTAGAPCRITDVDEHGHRRIQATNVDGALWTIREASTIMVARARRGVPGGSIITVASLAAIEGAGRHASYGASKGALLAMSNAAAVELARYGIRVNAVLPGWIATEMTASQQEAEEFETHVISRVPLRRWGRPEEFGAVAVFLASDASSYQTGSRIVIDGGYSIF
ncbi:SDR family oxidoreductase [Nocardioides ginkgobilobae]